MNVILNLVADVDYDELLEEAETQEMDFSAEPLIVLGIAVALIVAFLLVRRLLPSGETDESSSFHLERAEFETDTALEFKDIKISFATEFGTVDAVKGVSFHVQPGEVVAVVGESGSGKSVTSSTAMGLSSENATVSGQVLLDGKDVTAMNDAELRNVRGDDISMVFQEPMTALNPVLRVSDQMVEVFQIHGKAFGKDALAKSIELLRAVGIPDPDTRIFNYPHQFSGGQRQRIVIAMAVANNPKVIIADEPTTALDVTVQAEILDLLRQLKDESNTAILLITHNMGVVADMADRVVVMFQGEVVESGSAQHILTNPNHPYTQRLLEAMPELHSQVSVQEQEDIVATADEEESAAAGRDDYALQGKNLALAYNFRGKSNRVVEGVNFAVRRGEILGLVGESGSGKSTIAKAVLGLLDVDEGQLLIRGKNLPELSAKDRKALRKDIGVVFQDPAASLDPRFPIGDIIVEPMVVHKVGTPKERKERAKELLQAVKLPVDVVNRYPHELSGGQRQRISIARALTLNPSILIADEPTSALDVSVQARVLEMFSELQQQFNFACLFVTHDLAVVDQLADQIMVLQKGRVVEQGSKDQILRAPRQDYTKRLLAAAPVPHPVQQRERREARLELLAAQGLRVD